MSTEQTSFMKVDLINDKYPSVTERLSFRLPFIHLGARLLRQHGQRFIINNLDGKYHHSFANALVHAGHIVADFTEPNYFDSGRVAQIGTSAIIVEDFNPDHIYDLYDNRMTPPHQREDTLQEPTIIQLIDVSYPSLLRLRALAINDGAYAEHSIFLPYSGR